MPIQKDEINQIAREIISNDLSKGKRSHCESALKSITQEGLSEVMNQSQRKQQQNLDFKEQLRSQHS